MQNKQKSIPQVAHIVAVSAGKGGVGKSTTAVNLAVALSLMGKRVGLLDADIYGPSLPRMIGKKDEHPQADDNNIIQPVVQHGIKCMSMGFLMEEDDPVVWRGAMVMKAIEQMAFQTNWGKLDVLIIDMPPGTGDTQLTVAQKMKLTGSVVVSTPQDIALLDVTKGINMFKKVHVPVLGMVENMSYFHCPNCDHEAHIFGHGGAVKRAQELGLELLAEVPLDLDIRTHTDEGTPILIHKPDSEQAKIYRNLASKVWQQIENQPAIEPEVVHAANAAEGAKGSTKVVIE